ncbi:hypothetical protein, partial [Vibrio parahaemolyticus]|uniref:hypothetical protein n=1 Tax=Vibrio parahaemolyticus TaxID=670 RepID=UPI001C5E9DC8
MSKGYKFTTGGVKKLAKKFTLTGARYFLSTNSFLSIRRYSEIDKYTDESITKYNSTRKPTTTDHNLDLK